MNEYVSIFLIIREFDLYVKLNLGCGCVNILAAFPYRGDFYPDRPLVNTHSTPLECGNFGIRFSTDISRLWREEVSFISKETSLLQRSNISIEKDSPVLSHFLRLVM